MLDSLKHRIYRTDSRIVKGIATLLCPRLIFNSFYGESSGKGAFAFSLSFDCDFRKDIEAIPKLLDMLSSYDASVSFACVGRWIEKFKKPHITIVEEGHEIINHTYSHPDNEELNPRRFIDMGREEKKEEIKKCHEVCKRVLGVSPTGFRTPHFGNQHTDDVYGILKELGYSYSSSTIAIRTQNNGFPFIVDGIVEVPLSTCPRHPFGVFDSYNAIRSPRAKHKKEGELLGLFKELVETGMRNNALINIYMDPQDVVKIKDFEGMLEFLGEKKIKVKMVGEVAGGLESTD